ncbi:hypothetical protein Tco_1439441 [Tanacetum coccineum]
MEIGFLSYKGSGVGRAMKEKRALMPNKSVEVVNVNSATHADMGRFPSMSEIHGIYPLASVNEESLNDAGTKVERHGVHVTTFSKDGLSAIATKLGTPLMSDSYTSDMCIQSWDRSSYARALIEVRADVELKDNIVVAMPKLVGDGFYTCNVRVEYEWKPPRCTCCKVFGHVKDECPKNKDSNVVSKKNNVSTSGNKKKDAEPTIEVSKSNSFDVLNSVEKDVDLGTNGGTSNLASKKANSSGSSFWNVDSNSTSTTPIVEKIDKIERLIIDRMATLVDDEESYGNEEYDYDPYDDDMYEGQDIPDKIQDICDNLDIKVHGRGDVGLTLILCRFNLRRISLTGFPAQSVRSSNAEALDSPYLLVLNTGMSESRQHGKSESDSYYLSD